jgi:hypothetical protein
VQKRQQRQAGLLRTASLDSGGAPSTALAARDGLQKQLQQRLLPQHAGGAGEGGKHGTGSAAPQRSRPADAVALVFLRLALRLLAPAHGRRDRSRGGDRSVPRLATSRWEGP